jgi:hypothetical protein
MEEKFWIFFMTNEDGRSLFSQSYPMCVGFFGSPKEATDCYGKNHFHLYSKHILLGVFGIDGEVKKEVAKNIIEMLKVKFDILRDIKYLS